MKQITYFPNSESLLQQVNVGFGKTQFYCGRPQTSKACCFTHIIGLPKHPHTLTPMELMPYQKSFFKIIENTKNRKVHVNKARQVGLTELILRILQYRAFHKYAGGNIIIIAGTREKMSKTIMQRFTNLFYNISHEIVNQSDSSLELKNGTIIKAYPSNSDSIRGLTKIKAVFLDEAAHFNLIDDSKVMDAIKPIVETNKSDLFMISTPKGPTGFFYDIEKDDNDFLKLSYNIWEAVNWIYTQDEAEKMLDDPTVDCEQEYMNQYTTGATAFFGNIPERNQKEDILEVL